MKLNIGCGTELLDGYVNIDKFPILIRTDKDFRQIDILNISNYFQANSIDEIRAHHVFEHFTHIEVTVILFKLWMIMKPGGILSITTPDFYHMIIEQYQETEDHTFSNMDIFNLKFFSTEDETLHKSVWWESVGRWYLEREKLFKVKEVIRPSTIEIQFNARKL